MQRLFGTDGIRGIAGKDLTDELAYRVGRSLVNVLSGEKNRILIGMDTRESSPILAKAVARGISEAGSEAYLIGVCSTPAVAYLVKSGGYDAGVMISASHNPYQYNGIKIFAKDGFKLTDAMEDEIESLLYCDGENISGGKIISAEGATEEYVRYLADRFSDSLSGLKIGVDCANGSASVSAEKLFTSLGAECIMIGHTPNGRNINDGCGSTSLDQLKKLVVEEGLDLGIAFDGDADRCLTVNDRGEEVDGDFLMAILALWLKEEGELQKNTVVGTVMNNLGFIKFCEENEIDFIPAKVGDRYVLEIMNQNGYVFGGEQSGHLILGKFATTGDGQLTALALLNRIKKSGKSLRELAAVMKKYPQYSVNVKADAEDKAIFLADQKIKEMIICAEGDLDSGRLVIRPSGTEPLIRIMAEGKDQKQIQKICDNLAEKVKERVEFIKNSKKN